MAWPCIHTGIYQIAVASKALPDGTNVSSLTREEVESDLRFAGFLNFSNKLRSNTAGVIQKLNAADIQSIMLTGDSLFTGIHIARESGLIEKHQRVIIASVEDGEILWSTEENVVKIDKPMPETLSIRHHALAMTGETWQQILATDPGYALRIAPLIHVYGRCSPHDKVSVVDTFVALGFKTMMCGDGGNDCGALKAAHIGIALSDCDASIVAPFTSVDKDIASVVTVLKEGRASLASTIAVFTFLVMYGVTSSYCQVIFYSLDASFSDWMWVCVDGLLTISFGLTLPLALPAQALSKSRPASSIASTQTAASIIGMILINFVFTGIAFWVLLSQDWFQCRKWNADAIAADNVLAVSDNYEVSVVFLMVCSQILGAAISMNFGYEFRRSWCRNYVFVAFVLGFSFLLSYIVFVPGKLSCFWRINCTNDNVVRSTADPNPAPINNLFATTVMPEEFQWKLWVMMASNVLALTVYNYFIVNGIRRFKDNHRARRAIVAEKNPNNQDENLSASYERVSRFRVNKEADLESHLNKENDGNEDGLPGQQREQEPVINHNTVFKTIQTEPCAVSFEPVVPPDELVVEDGMQNSLPQNSEILSANECARHKEEEDVFDMEFGSAS